MDIPEEELVKKSQKGDIEAFEVLIIRYERKIYNIAYRFMGNYDDASDAAQEAIIKTFYSLKNFRREASFQTWLYHVVSNVCKDELRKKSRVQVSSLDVPLETEDGEIWRQTTDSSRNPEKLYESKELQVKLQGMIKNLPSEYRMVLVMREFLGFTYEEIAEELGCSLGTVKSRLNRARRSLRREIIKEEELFQQNVRLTK